jgi:non-canonical poly(A) RNA polymerase PAPD5/7
MLCLCDPADVTNDLGRKGISIKHVQATLRHLDRKLSMDLRADTRHSFLRPLVGDIFALNRARRKRLVEEGRTVLDTMHSSLAQTARLIREEEITAREMHNKVAETEEVKSEEGLDTPGDAVASDSTLPCADEFGNEEVQKEGSGKDDGSEPAITYQVKMEKEEMEGSEKDDGSELSTTDHRSRE